MDSSNQNAAAIKKACVSCGREFVDDRSFCPDDGTLLTPLLQELGPGSVLGERYEIVGVIADGGMGRVYKAKHLLMKRQVAVKMLHPHLVSSATALKRFQQEAEAASALSHPNILTIFDFGLTDKGQPYLVMDYLEGTSLALLLQESGYLDVRRSVPIFIQVCAGLSHAHQKGVIHRDLKPANIMLVDLDGNPDFVKVVDFGIAKLTTDDGESRNLTQTGEVFGSPLYMSPEQCRGIDLDARADVYSIGCVFYRTLTGHTPVGGKDLLDCMYKQANERAASFSEVSPELNLPDMLEAIVFKAMEKDPTLRYQSMVELKQALELFYYDSGADVRSTMFTSALPSPVIPAAESSLPANVSNEPRTTSSAPASAEATNPDLIPLEAPVAPVENANSLPAVRGKETWPGRLNKLVVMTRRIDRKILVATAAFLILMLIGFLLSRLHGPGGNTAVIEQKTKAEKALEAGNYAEAENHAALMLRESKSTPQHDEALNLLGQIEYAKGDYEASRAYFQQLLSRLQKEHGEGSAEVAVTQTDLGRALIALGAYSNAEPLLRESLTTRKKLFGPVDIEVADSLSALGYLYLRQGKYSDAVNSLSSALDIRQQLQGPQSPDAATSMNDLGQAYQLQHNYAEAEDLYKKALKIRQKILAADNPLLADSFTCLGSLYAQTGKYHQAQELLKKALSIQEKVFSPGNPNTARTRKLYAQVAAKVARPR